MCTVGLTWRIQYVGQASDPQYDQTLTEVEMDCPQPGQMKFVLEVSVKRKLLVESLVTKLLICLLSAVSLTFCALRALSINFVHLIREMRQITASFP